MNDTSTIKINSRQFGELEISSENIFHFPDGLLGFEELHEYVLINFEQTAPFKWLLSIENSEIGFPVINPWLIDLNYKPGKKIDPKHEVPMVVVNINSEGAKNITANMKAPIILDADAKTGMQSVLTSDKYSTNQPIIK